MNVDECWWILVREMMNVDECWWILLNLGARNDGSWWILMNIGARNDKCWWMLMNIDECWWILMNLIDCWWSLMCKKESSWKNLFFLQKKILTIKNFQKKISFFFANDFFIKVSLVEIRKNYSGKKVLQIKRQKVLLEDL